MDLKEIIGFKVHGIIHYYPEKKLSISFYNSNWYIEFYDCLLVIDTGIINTEIEIAEEYEGEMGFIVGFREMKLPYSEYDNCKYFILKGKGRDEHYQNQIRIAYKHCKLEKLKND